MEEEMKKIEAMLDDGLIVEVSSLIDAGFEETLTSSQAIGYKEFVPIITGGLPIPGPAYDAAVEDMKTATRRYAKRQRTWIRRDGNARWIDASRGFTETELAQCLEMVDLFMKEHSG